MASGAAMLVAAAAVGRVAPLPPEFAPYCAGALYLAALAWLGLSQPAVGALPPWLSPPALIAGWTVAWIYGPATVSFFDGELLDEFLVAQGGHGLLLSGLFLACVAVTTLSCSFFVTQKLLGHRERAPERGERTAALQRIVVLYALSASSRALRVAVVGAPFGADTTLWGALAPADQWFGYMEDSRYLALALLAAHVVRHGTGRTWLAVALVVEGLFAATSGFIKPFIWPVVVCIATIATLDRIRTRHVVLGGAAVVLVSAFWPVVASIREDWTGGIGRGNNAGLSASISASLAESQGAGAVLESAYKKFFGRQAEVAASTGLVVALTPAVLPFEGFQQFLLLPTKLVPRALWPDKPILSRGQWFSVNYRGLEEDTTSSSAMTLFGEGYLFYGWPGACLAMVLVGSILAILYRCLNRAAFQPVYLALLPTILEIEPELSSYVTSLVQRAAVFVVVFFVFTYRSKSIRQ